MPLVTQSCLILYDPLSLPGPSVHEILQARILEWVSMPFSRGSSSPRDRSQVSCIGRQILYHLSHQGRPNLSLVTTFFVDGKVYI